MNIYIVRHGQTDWNVQPSKIQGCTDISLNETGINQAYEAKETLNAIKFDRIYTSPLSRTLKTAMIIATDPKIITIDDRLKERYMGCFEGQNRVGYYEPYWIYHDNLDDGEIEPIQNLFARCESFLEDIKKENKKNVLLVSHGATIRVLKYILEGYDPKACLLNKVAENAEVLHYELD